MKIFYDVDTQNDFMNKDGALYVPGAEEIKPNLKKLTDYARENKMPVFGSVDKHFGTPEYKERELELQKWSGPFPMHAEDNKMGGPSKGQKHIPETALKKVDPFDLRGDERMYLACMHADWGLYIENPLLTKIDREELRKKAAETWPGVDLTQEIEEQVKKSTTGIFEEHIRLAFYQLEQIKEGKLKPQGIYFEKQSYNVFTNPNTEELLKRAEAKEAVVYGVATDYCVKAAVLGMQKRGIQCYVVEDAISGVTPETTKSALEEMVKAGAKFVKTSDVLEGKVI